MTISRTVRAAAALAVALLASLALTAPAAHGNTPHGELRIQYSPFDGVGTKGIYNVDFTT